MRGEETHRERKREKKKEREKEKEKERKREKRRVSMGKIVYLVKETVVTPGKWLRQRKAQVVTLQAKRECKSLEKREKMKDITVKKKPIFEAMNKKI